MLRFGAALPAGDGEVWFEGEGDVTALGDLTDVEMDAFFLSVPDLRVCEDSCLEEGEGG